MKTNGDQRSDHFADISAQRVARVYSEALLNAADKSGEADAVQEQLDSLVHEVFRANPQFKAFLGSGAVGRPAKGDVIRHAFQGRASALFFKFLMVLNEHERLDLLRPVAAAYKDLRDQRARRIRVQVRSAVPLGDDQRLRLQRELHDTFRLEPVLESSVDPGLIGGLVVRVGDWVYDASVRTQLENIRKHLIESSSHEIQSGRDRFSSDARDR